MDAVIGFLTAVPDAIYWGSIISFVIFAIIRGWLVPVASHEREINLLKDNNTALITEKNEWRALAKESEATVYAMRDQNKELIELSRTSAHALSEISRRSEENRVQPQEG